MKTATPVIKQSWLTKLLSRATAASAAWAGYNAAIPTKSRNSAGRIGTNTNSSYSQMQRVQLQWDGQYVGKNSPIGRAYLSVRQMYCNPKSYVPTTGDSVLDDELKMYLDETWKRGGQNCSLWEAFGRSANVEQPCGGDSALIWYRDVDQLRLIEACADQIGELYQFTRAAETTGGLMYFAGMFFEQGSWNRTAFKIYDRGFNDYYLNPQVFAAGDVLYFQDNLFKAYRGLTEFAAVIDNIYKSDKLIATGIDAAERQAKTAIVVFNRQGQADDTTYETEWGGDGEIIYSDKTGYDGPMTEFRYVGDDYKVVNATSPGPELIEGCRYLDEKTALGLRLPYSFLVNAKEVGGASNRLEINKAGHELERIQEIHRPKLDIISYVYIMDAVDRRIFPAIKGITKGEWQFPNLPIADAFREDQSDIASLRAGTQSRGGIIGKTGSTFPRVARQKMVEAVEIERLVAEGNENLEKLGLAPSINRTMIAQDSEQQIQQQTVTTSDGGEGDALISQIGIGGTQALVQVQQQIASGVLDRESGINTLMIVFGVTREQATAMAPQKGSAAPEPGTEQIAKVTPSGSVPVES